MMAECYTSAFWCSWWSVILVVGIFTFILWITTLIVQRINQIHKGEKEMLAQNKPIVQ